MFFEVPKLHNTLLDPSLPNPEKKKIILTACGGIVPSSLGKMIDLILKNEREESIQYIALRYIDRYREKFHIQHGKLITAVEMDSETHKRLIIRIEKVVGGEIELEPIVDPAIMGGFVLHLGDYRWDASIAGELTRIRKRIDGVKENSVKTEDVR